MQNKWIGLILLVVFGIGIYVALIITPPGYGDDENLEQKTSYMSWYPQERALSEFELTQHNGETFTNQSLIGKWTLVFVGYTFCPDICPVTLAGINEVYPALSESVKTTPLQVWFLSVDPKRDTAARLNEYINFFNPEFIGATGSHKQLFPLVRSMGMMYSLSESTDNPNYLVDHSASIVVINPRANVVGRFKPTHVLGKVPSIDTQQLLQDIPLLLKSE